MIWYFSFVNDTIRLWLFSILPYPSLSFLATHSIHGDDRGLLEVFFFFFFFLQSAWMGGWMGCGIKVDR